MMSPAPFDLKDIFISFLLLLTGCSSYVPSEQVSVAEPTSVTVATMSPDNSLLIEIRKDQSVWYRIINNNETEQSFQKVKGTIRENLAKIIRDYKRVTTQENKKSNFIIKGHSDAGYPVFEKIISALKDNQEYKYQLTTMKDEE